ATIRNQVLVPNIFARQGQNPLVFTPSLEALNWNAYNPAPRLIDRDDSRRLAAQVAPVADQCDLVDPPILGVYVVGYHVPCYLWPSDLRVRPVWCEPGFSLVEIIPSDVGEAVP
ncbi:MAG TPA: hypothetical protein VLL76_06145, partial [Candidatus Omnitrophota bacterium]|nr:hypothetical protein [Candidatus Omnitrophota bacterium]